MKEIIDRIIQKIVELLERLAQLIDKMRQAAEILLQWLPVYLSYLTGKIRDAVEAAASAILTFIQWAQEQLKWVGSPGQLSAAATTWLADVGQPSAQQSYLVDKTELEVDDHWKGEAAQRYVEVLPNQSAALSSILDNGAQPVADALNKAGNAIIGYWTAFSVALGAFIGTSVAAVVATSVTFGASLAIILVAAGVAFAAIFTADKLAVNQMDQAGLLIRGAEAKLRGQWPTFVQ